MIRCSSCKEHKEHEAFHKHRKGKHGRSTTCKACISARCKRPEQRAIIVARTRQWRENNPISSWISTTLTHAKSRAKERNVPYNLTHEYLRSIITTHCPVFGTEFVFRGNKVLGDESASIDRIDPKKGYIEGNIAIISIKANRIKSAYTSDDLMKVANWLKDIENDKT